MNKPFYKRSLFVLVSILSIVFVIIYCGIRFMDSAVFSKSNQEEVIDTSTRKTITVGDTSYFPRQDITVILVMGIDKYGKVESSNSYNNDGESDVIALLVFDNENETFTVLNINRDSMVDMPLLGVTGKKIGTKFGQIALSHTYGSGLEDSCENTRATVSAMLNSINIDYYIAANMDVISIMNDAVGGVKVNVTDDFSKVDETIPMGEIRLNGSQALNFVRTRKEIGDQLNLSRMDRHEEFLKGFLHALEEKTSSSNSFGLDLYTAVEGYIVTDCSMKAFSGMFSDFADYELKEVVTLKGENKMGKKFIEYYLDEDYLQQTTLDLFYAPKN